MIKLKYEIEDMINLTMVIKHCIKLYKNEILN